MTDINFLNIRTINGKQDEGFEELVCQLARKINPINSKRFIRKGKPDAGVECILQMNDDTEWGWQAKYFLNSLGNTQWRDLDESVKTALDKHPKLVIYYVAIPINMPDAKLVGKKSMLDKWDIKVKEWEKLSQEKGMNVKFIYWGYFELVEMLSKREHEGMIYFWFNKTEFTDDWFEDNIKNATQILLNKRYTPKLNFELPIAKMFDGFARDENLKSQIDVYFKNIFEKFGNINSHLNSKSKKKVVKKIITDFEKIIIWFKGLDLSDIKNIDYILIQNIITSTIESCDTYNQELYSSQQLEVQKDPDKYKYSIKPNNNEIHYLRLLSRSLNELSEFLNSQTCTLVNSPYLIIESKAGMGKSHLLADIVNNRYKNGYLSLFLLGQHFTNDDNPWTQILSNQLRFPSNEYVFLGALNSKAESTGKRIIIFIDALNEGNGKNFWSDYLKNFIDLIKKFKWLGLVVSIRTSYIKLIAPQEIITDDDMLRVYHNGFGGFEYEAAKHFFLAYGIEQPNMPLFQPEFQNPLFLKLLCEGLVNRGLKKLTDGFWGIKQSFNFFIDSVNEKLSNPKNLDFSPSINLVQRVIDSLLEWKVENKKRYIPYAYAYEVAHEIFRKNCTKGSNYFDMLISEGIFSEDLYWDRTYTTHEKGIYLAYERFEDHLFASAIIDKYIVNKKNPLLAFKSGYLYEITKSENDCSMNQGILEALSIQLPERIKKELYELVPRVQKCFSICEAFIESIFWRKSESFTEKTLEYVNLVAIKYNGTNEKFLEMLISVSVRPNHFFNADFLHKQLLRYTLASRDAWWTIYINDKYDYNSIVKRLIDWSWQEEDKSYVDDDVILLTSMTLAWFLTSCNRYLRDAATKGLVNLLENRIQLLKPLLQKFENVNDPYVYERLFAVAYGSAVRSEKLSALKELSEYIFEEIFNKEKVYPHILLRDYAKGVIDFTIHSGIKLKFDLAKIQPPYKSDLPNKFPTNTEIDKKYKIDYKSKKFKDSDRGQNAILDSMVTEYGRGTSRYGDFGRYTFERGLSHFKVDANKWSNWAVEEIFKLGYKSETHG